MTAKGAVLAALPKLTPAELVEVRGAVTMLLGRGPGQDTGGITGDDWLLAGIADYLVRRGLLAKRHAQIALGRRAAYKHYVEKRVAVIQFLEQVEKNNGLGLRDRITLSFLCARALANLLTRRNVFSPGAMLTQIDKIPEALDHDFPGYASSGLFGFVLRNQTKDANV